jgi:hypothetical protein
VYICPGVTGISFIPANAAPPPPLLAPSLPAAPPPHASTLIVVTPGGTVKGPDVVNICGDVICEKAAIENNKKNRGSKFFNVG